jgi:Trypsin-like peptidase domain
MYQMSSVKTVISKVEKSLSVKQKLIIGGAIILSFGLLTQAAFEGSTDPIYNSVMITNTAGNSGGTGVVLSSSVTTSTILTNAHVCHLVAKSGGLVRSSDKQFMVTHTKSSLEHDLCLIQVNGNFNTSTEIASTEPVSFYAKAIIAGHPNLYPTVVTSGHFSGNQVIQVMTGLRDCTEDERNGPLGLICVITGGKIPVVRSFESTLVTATIMAGSSGSAVYDESGKLAGLVFAGQGDLSYAFIVPYTAVKRFLDVEQFDIAYTAVDNNLDITNLLRSRPTRSTAEDKAFDSLDRLCKNNDKSNEAVNVICENTASDMLWRK